MVELIPKMNGNLPHSDEQKQQIINDATVAYEKFLDALRLDWRNDHNSTNTPNRVAKAYVNDIIAGCYDAPPEITSFPNDGYDGIVSQCNIPVVSLCSHHMMQFTGVAHVAYIPSKDGQVVGLSKLNRLVEHYSRRPQLQESLTQSIHDSVNTACGGNLGVAVVVKAVHTCACNRGIKHSGCAMVTSKLSGDFLKDEKTRTEFYKFIDIATK